METDQAEQLLALLSQSANVLNVNGDTEEMDASTTSKQDNRSLSPFDSKDTQTEIIMAKKKDTNLITCRQQLEITKVSKSIVKPQKGAPTNL